MFMKKNMIFFKKIQHSKYILELEKNIHDFFEMFPKLKQARKWWTKRNITYVEVLIGDL